MIATLTAALSLAAALAIDVPYLPQTDALCGGAAAAMVFRYWGDAHADAQSFAPLVDREAGGIANGALTAAIQARGWRTGSVAGSLDAIRDSVNNRRPVIVLLPDRGARYHYVVVIGASGAGILVHDPSWGPSRSIRAPDFEREWRAAGFWSLVISPPDSGSPPSSSGKSTNTRLTTSSAGQVPSNPADAECDARLNRALDEIRVRGLDQADALLTGVRMECPASPGPLRELSAVRFAQHRWTDAASLAREALGREPGDEYALDVLGSSLFMLHDEIGALRAWNQIGKPRVNRVRIEGLHHMRYQTMAEVMALQPNMLLTVADFERAQRRLGELPDRAATRLAVSPELDGFASVDVVIVELSALPHGAIEWAGAAARTAANREIDVAIPGGTSQGEMWSAGWRWWSHRPGVSVGFGAPRVRPLPGVWRFDASWQSDTYAGAAESRIIESRTHGGLTVSDWLSGHLRYSVTTGLDAWSGGRKAASLGGSLARVAFRDRLSLSIDATQWAPLSGGDTFRSARIRAVARSSPDPQRWVLRGAAGFERVSDTTPLTLWPGAGEGYFREPLLRAHPLLSDGIVDLTAASAFGRSLAFGSAEMQRWFERPALVRGALPALPTSRARRVRPRMASRRRRSILGSGFASKFRGRRACYVRTSRTGCTTARTR